MIDRLLASRQRWPDVVNRAIDRVADRPSGFAGRLAALRFGSPRGQRELAVSHAGDTPFRVLIAPVNYSGQARAWARALEALDERITASNFAVDVPGGFDFPADLVVPVATYQNGAHWQRRELNAIGSFTHLLVEAREPVLGRLFGRDTDRQLHAVAALGVDIAYMCHGTEVRLPSRHRKSTSWSPYSDAALYTQRLETIAARNIDALASSEAPVFVSTPDLLADVPFGVWCPVVIDIDTWAVRREPVRRDLLRVVHTPSSALMKGTALIEPVLKRLHADGVIDYRPVKRVASSEMPAVYAAADIVLDQFRLGSYGVAACEAMAAGCAVVGHVLDSVRTTVQQATATPLPIIEATPDTLDSVLRALASSPSMLQDARDSSAIFVAAQHDGRASARVLVDSWIERGVR